MLFLLYVEFYFSKLKQLWCSKSDSQNRNYRKYKKTQKFKTSWKYFFKKSCENNTKKVSYAGSFGLSSLDEQYHEKIANLLNDFDHVSVREKQAAKIIKDISGKDVPVVCDPTLLLTKEEWKKAVDNLIAKGLLVNENDRIKLTDKGLDFANQVFVEFI